MDEQAATAAVEDMHRSPIPAAPTSPFSSPLATSSIDTATEATGERREEDSSDKNVEDVAPPVSQVDVEFTLYINTASLPMRTCDYGLREIKLD